MKQKLESTLKYVEVEVNSKCNRACSYCPVSVLPEPDVPLYMSDVVFDRIINELVSLEFNGIFSYHFYNEPLLRDDLENLVCRVKQNLPKVNQVLYTNGDKLSEVRYLRLCEAGINYFVVSNHSCKNIPERPRQKVLTPNDLIITNRGGIFSKVYRSLAVPCYSPAERLIVTVTGDVLLCCCDAGRTQVMGNIRNQPLYEIWFNKRFVLFRKLLWTGKRSEAASICRYCNDTEYSSPGNDHHKEFFEFHAVSK